MEEEVSAQKALRQEELLRRKRRRAVIYRRRRLGLVAAVVALCLVVLAVVIAVGASRSTEQVSADALLAGGTRSPAAPVNATGEERPAFARVEDHNLLLPVAAGDATIVAYQPVDDERAIALTPIGQKVNANAVVRFFRDIFSADPTVRYYQLDGGSGEPTSSVLVGAAPGSFVTAPVKGVVTRVKEYLLYGKYDDIQIDIRPTGMSGVTISMLFIDEPVVTIGQEVDPGDMLGKVRQCPEELGKAIAEYTHDSGSHVYLQATGEPID